MYLQNRWLRILPALVVVLGVLLLQGPRSAFAANANLNNVFQLDGNAQTCPSGTSSSVQDWDIAVRPSLTATGGVGYSSGNTPAASCASSATYTPFDQTFIHDGINAADTTVFAGGGSKDICDPSVPLNSTGCASKAWGSSSGMSDDKNDLTNAYAAAYIVPVNDGGTLVNHLVLTFGSDRYAVNGSAQMSFWFTHQSIGPNASGGFNGTHVNDDLLIQVNFSNGGAIGSESVYKWFNGGLVKVQDVANPTCGPSNTGAACSRVNTSSVVSPWPYQPKSGSANNFPTSAFMEGGVDVTSLLGGTECFASFIAETRSSTPFDAQLKDFAQHSFPICGANIAIGPSQTNWVGAKHTFHIGVTQSAIGGTPTGVSGASVTATITNASTATDGTFVSTSSSPTCTSPPAQSLTTTGTTDGSGNLDVTVFACTPGTVVVSATATYTAGGQTFAASTDGVGSNTGPATKTYATARIRLSPHTAINIVGNEHTLPTTLEYSTDGSTWSPVTGAAISFSFASNSANALFTYSTTGGAITPPTSTASCTTVASAQAGPPALSVGQCAIKINSSQVGTAVVHAAANNFSVSGINGTFSVATSATATDESGDATKTYINPQTQLLVKDQMTGLPDSATGSVTYSYFTTSTCSDAGTDAGGGGALTLVNGHVWIPSSDQVTVGPGNHFYFRATYTGNLGSFTTPCTDEQVAVN